MPTENLKFNKKLLSGMIFFLVFLGLILFQQKHASAAEPDNNEEGTCTIIPSIVRKKMTRNDCDKACTEQINQGYTGKCHFSANKFLSTTEDINPENCDLMKTPGVCLLSPVHWFVKKIFMGAVTFFGWVIKTNNLALILNGGRDSSSGVIYKMWQNVRDILNLAFIIVLLFSAFATIFQIDKYNYKKILLMLVIMALLVNFSYPISRFLIDASNVMMYSLINSFFSNSDSATFFTTQITQNSGLETILNVKYTNAGAMLTAIIFLFLFGITLFAFAILLFIRMVALAILIIFSPIGFVGYVMPGFQSFASQWWDNLFKYAFFGPIMMLGLAICVKMMAAISILSNFESIAQEVSKNTDPNFLGKIAFLMIPLILLWMTMSISQKMSIEGAAKAQAFAMKAGKKFSGYNLGKNVYDKYSAERKKRKDILDKTAWSSRLGSYVGSKPGEWRDRAQGAMRKGDKWYQGAPGSKAAQTRISETQKRDIAEKRKAWKDTGVSEKELSKSLAKGSLAERRAAALEMAEKRGFGSGEDAKKNYKLAIDALEGDKISQEIFNDKVKEKHVKLVMDYEIGQGIRTEPQAYAEYIDKMNADQLSKQKGLLSDKSFIDNYLRNRGDSDPKFIEEVAKKMSQADRNKWIEENLIQNEGGNSRGRAGFV